MLTRKKIILGAIALACVFAATIIGRQKASPPAPMKKDTADSKIVIGNFKFEPQTITVKAGSTVTWENKEGVHTVTSDTNAFSSPTLTGSKSFSHKFVKAGKYPYYCTFHGSKGGGGMSGKVIVVK